MNTIGKCLVSLCVALWASALSAQTHFSFDQHEYQYDMTVYYTLTDTKGEVVENPDNYEIAAFVGDECRGIGTFGKYTGENGELTYGTLRVWSNVVDGETVTIKCYNKEDNEEMDVKGVSISFVSQAMEGLPSEPVKLTVEIPAYILGDVNGDGKVNINDYISVANHILGNSPAGFNEAAADINGDGKININDYIGVANIILTGSPTGK